MLIKRTLPLATFLILSLFLVSCAKKVEVQKSPLRIEAEQYAQKWWDSTFAKCGDDYFTLYSGSAINSDDFMFFDEGIIQSKNVSYEVTEKPLTETDKLNGIEWQGELKLTFAPHRFYKDKWSRWEDHILLYAHVGRMTIDDSLSVMSPSYIAFKKVKGQWYELGEYPFRKPSCSEIPQG